VKDVSVGISDDYAVVSFDSGSFYYGYEVRECSICGGRGNGCPVHDDSDHEWCFKAVVNETTWIYPHSELMTNEAFNVTENLLAGIGKWMNESTFIGEL
jgi:hypothetical protein